jgi:uncharacterized membrane protein YeiH
MPAEEFQLPITFDLTATFLFAVTGALAGMRRHYDIIGVFVLAFATALGGGLIRDGIFFSSGPPVAITTGYYLPVVAAAVIGTILLGQRLVPPTRTILGVLPGSEDDTLTTFESKPPSAGERGERGRKNLLERIDLEQHLTTIYATVLSLVDALGVGIYAVVGAEKSLNFGLPLSAAVLVGAVNAAGGGLLRDVLTREVPLLFKPGQFYALTAVIGAVLFVTLARLEQMTVQNAALVAIASTFVLRVLAIQFDWRTRPLVWEERN